MSKYVITVKHGNNGVSAVASDIDSGKVVSFDIHGPREEAETLFNELLKRADVEIKHE